MRMVEILDREDTEGKWIALTVHFLFGFLALV